MALGFSVSSSIVRADILDLVLVLAFHDPTTVRTAAGEETGMVSGWLRPAGVIEIVNLANTSFSDQVNLLRVLLFVTTDNLWPAWLTSRRTRTDGSTVMLGLLFVFPDISKRISDHETKIESRLASARGSDLLSRKPRTPNSPSRNGPRQQERTPPAWHRKSQSTVVIVWHYKVIHVVHVIHGSTVGKVERAVVWKDSKSVRPMVRNGTLKKKFT
jgi:hypothetical protein